MSRKRVLIGCAVALAVYVAIAVGFYFIAGDRLHYRIEQTDMLANEMPIGELLPGTEIAQPFEATADEVRAVTLLLSTYSRTNSGTVKISIADPENGEELGFAELNASDIEDNANRRINFLPSISIEKGKRYELRISSENSASGNAITAWQGSSVSAAKGEVDVAIADWEKLRVGETTIDAKLCYEMELKEDLVSGTIYWYVAAAGMLLLIAYAAYNLLQQKRGGSTMALKLAAAFTRYNFLLRQLVSRDFKSKYKRSVLGICWSFLNPLLTMLVQYLVFSTLFKSDIPNFAVYLLTGIVCYSFFSESTGMALSSIVGNAALITKVYVPKYIYPLTRTISSAINFLLALLPLFAVLLITQTPIKASILLFPFGVFCLFCLCLGVGMLLSTLMVFFRDTQFLWGVISMLWMYATPIFYPETIIPASIMPLFKCNPLYHIIRFFRIILIDGVSPEPKAYLLCLVVSLVPLLIGAFVFKKQQDKFAINL